MTLRLKTLVVVSATFAALFIILVVTGRPVVMDGYENQEVVRAREHLTWAQRTLELTHDDLGREAIGFAEVPTSLRWALGGPVPKEYLRSERERLRRLQITAVVLLGKEGRTKEVVTPDGSPIDTGRVALGAAIAALKPHEALQRGRQWIAGIVGVDGVYWGVAMAPVLDRSAPEGHRGFVAVARLLNLNANRIHPGFPNVQMSFLDLSSPGLPAGLMEDAQDQVEVVGGRVIAHHIVPDLVGDSGVVLRLSSEAFLMKVGRETALLVALIQLVAGLVVLLAVVMVLERIVVQRIGALARRLALIKDQGDDTLRVNVSGGDEIGDVERATNTLLGANEDSTAALRQWAETLEHRVLTRTDELDRANAEMRRGYEDRLRLEEEIDKAHRLEALGTLAGGIAHDFNNLLTAILGNISLVQGRLPADEKSLRFLGRAEHAADRAQGLMQQLLTFSKGGAPVRRLASIAELIRETADFSVIGSHVRCEVVLEPDLSAVSMDSDQISQVLGNLLINAQEAMPNGGRIRVLGRNTKVHKDDPVLLEAGDYVQISVLDTGVGIRPEVLPQVFHPYFSTKETGTGMGLATAWSIVHRHDGLLRVDSVLGEGTTFHLWLPARAGEQVVFALPAYSSEPAPPLEAKHILIMDDESMIVELVRGMLKVMGHTSEAAADGEEAVAKYATALKEGRRFDAAIIDLTIPGGMGGEEAIGHLKALDDHIVAIVSSGYSNAPVMSDYPAYGFAAALAKPYRSSDLAAVLARVLRNRPPPDPEPGAEGEGVDAERPYNL